MNKTLIALASWSGKDESVRLAIDFKALGLDPATATIAGQSLLKITYRASYQRFLVEYDGTEQVQVSTDVEASATSSSPNMVRVVRWPGNREAPDVIADPLCTTVAIKTERGRNYLEAEGYLKERYEVVTPPRPFVLPGAIAEVHDASLGASWRAKITGWRMSAATSEDAMEASVTWDFEQSLL
jgi:hypothetical protein